MSDLFEAQFEFDFGCASIKKMRFSLVVITVCAFLAVRADDKPPHPDNESWTALKAGMDQIFRREKSLTILQYMDLVKLVHDYCTKTNLNLSTAKRGGAELAGQELYERLTDYLEAYLVELFKGRGDSNSEDLLIFYAKTWAEYRFASRVVHGVFNYLNRHWVRREVAEGRKEVHEVFQLALLKWREHIVKHDWNKKLSGAAIKLIERERNGDPISQYLVSGLVNSLTELDLDDQDKSFYRDNFEQQFIQETERFYLAESNEYIHKHSIVEYIKHVERRLQEEADRVEAYLYRTTLSVLIKTCERIMIEAHLESIRAEFQPLLSTHKVEDLRSMYSLLARLDTELYANDLYAQLETYVHKEGLTAIAHTSKEAVAEPKIYVQAIIDVHKKYADLVQTAFNNDPGLVKALDEACKKFVNDNEVVKISKSPSKTSELFAKYSHNLLKKSAQSPNEDELSDLLDQLIVVFKYIDNKDAFQTYYGRLLAKRLINQASISDDAETLMLTKLKEVCGAEYISKLQRMFQDITVSRDLTNKYREHQRESANAPKGIDLNFQILSTGSWPSIGGQGVDLIMPPELQQSADSFSDFYGKEHNNRKLTWQHNLGKGEIVTNYLKQRYVLMVSTYQMAVLLQFNGVTSHTVKQLSENTGISQDYLIQVLQVLLKAKVLICPDAEEKLTAESKIELNMAFKA